ncbi:MAG: UPF0175 family protein [Candidatus Methanoperedens sp.]|nr:UPF0175 family protein [Candidatus Methanoperedens sp.]
MKIEKAIEKYKKGGVSLAKAAELAGISIREMVPIAYAHRCLLNCIKVN